MAKREQLNIRLPSEAFEVLEARGFIKGETVPEYVRSVLEEHVAQLSHDPSVQAALRARAEGRAEASGKLTRIENHRGAG